MISGHFKTWHCHTLRISKKNASSHCWSQDSSFYFKIHQRGAPHHYKNRFNFVNLFCYKQGFNKKAELHFQATAHRKEPCNGLGGTLNVWQPVSVLKSYHYTFVTIWIGKIVIGWNINTLFERKYSIRARFSFCPFCFRYLKELKNFMLFFRRMKIFTQKVQILEL